jgi:hypothetical protein
VGAGARLLEDEKRGGFALIAVPAAHGNIGIVTHIVDREGVDREQDFGEDKADLRREIAAFDPGAKWQKAQSSDIHQTNRRK